MANGKVKTNTSEFQIKIYKDNCTYLPKRFTEQFGGVGTKITVFSCFNTAVMYAPDTALTDVVKNLETIIQILKLQSQRVV